jgi:cytohesin
MNNKRLISLIICWILVIVPGLCVLSFADNESGTNTKAEQHFEKANELHILANYDAAIAEYKKVISLSPNSKIAQNAQYWIGQLYLESGQFDAALSAFQKLLDEYPTSKIIPSTKLMMERVQQAKKNKSLLEAVKKSDLEQVKLLILKGADVNAKVGNGDTLLHIAAQLGHEDVTRLLISKGADVNAKSNSSWTPLHRALKAGNREIVDLLISKGADVNAKGISDLTPLHFAADGGSQALVQLLIAKGAVGPAFHLAACLGDLARVKHFLDQGNDVDAKDECGCTPLHWAVWTGQRNVAEFIIAKGANVNTGMMNFYMSGRTPLHQAASAGNRELVESLISKGADVNANCHGSTPLHAAASIGHRDIVELLITEGTSVNAKDIRGWTPLHNTRRNDNKDVAEILIARGADVNAKDNSGRTTLHFICWRGRKDLAELLITKGADINARDNQGRTPMQWAKDRGYIGYMEIVELLRKHGAKE